MNPPRTSEDSGPLAFRPARSLAGPATTVGTAARGQARQSMMDDAPGKPAFSSAAITPTTVLPRS